jgi:hypothetical protein
MHSAGHHSQSKTVRFARETAGDERARGYHWSAPPIPASADGLLALRNSNNRETILSVMYRM